MGIIVNGFGTPVDFEKEALHHELMENSGYVSYQGSFKDVTLVFTSFSDTPEIDLSSLQENIEIFEEDESAEAVEMFMELVNDFEQLEEEEEE